MKKIKGCWIKTDVSKSQWLHKYLIIVEEYLLAEDWFYAVIRVYCSLGSVKWTLNVAICIIAAQREGCSDSSIAQVGCHQEVPLGCCPELWQEEGSKEAFQDGVPLANQLPPHRLPYWLPGCLPKSIGVESQGKAKRCLLSSNTPGPDCFELLTCSAPQFMHRGDIRRWGLV